MPPGNDISWNFIVDLNPRLIERIEAKRRGQDVSIRLSLTICGIERGADGL